MPRLITGDAFDCLLSTRDAAFDCLLSAAAAAAAAAARRLARRTRIAGTVEMSVP
tara:strand:- start:282 stop:446 length:165 start_codon:yes stop_codon:yes gene_type:complete